MWSTNAHWRVRMKLWCSIYCDMSSNKLKLCLHDLKLPFLSQNVNSSSKTSVLPLLVDLVKCTYSLSKCMPYEVKIHGIEVWHVLKNSLYSNLPLNPWSSPKKWQFLCFSLFLSTMGICTQNTQNIMPKENSSAFF